LVLQFYFLVSKLIKWRITTKVLFVHHYIWRQILVFRKRRCTRWVSEFILWRSRDNLLIICWLSIIQWLHWSSLISMSLPFVRLWICLPSRIQINLRWSCITCESLSSFILSLWENLIITLLWNLVFYFVSIFIRIISFYERVISFSPIF
jgi:hypothetical protein